MTLRAEEIDRVQRTREAVERHERLVVVGAVERIACRARHQRHRLNSQFVAVAFDRVGE